MKNEYQTILEEINTTVQRETAKDAEVSMKAQEARNRYDAALAKKQRALDAGDREQYQAAGLEAEAARLDVEFFERLNAMKRTPGATREQDIRISAALRMEAQQTKADALAQLRQIFTEAVDVANATLAKLTEIETTAKKWESIVMKRPGSAQISSASDRLTLAQFGNAANGQLQRFKLLK